ncbi:thioredoxin family protein [Metabacillus fastidiosus]|uniref:thioredoxin family protein n=1 Tax=Metabacillus fastidiosus TaxID=1458 RepID=UPI002DBD0E5F|nr:thioredoxin family protein [Metabacillus fastidiosus]MEC2075578.1 thioredoxin family protein [Metabacillus fastidiosus]
MKKVIIFGAILIVLFGALAFVTLYSQKQQTEGNPYGKDKLNSLTIKQLDDPNYQNIILPEEVEKKIENKEDFIVYFYSPDCQYCQATTPVLMPVAKEAGVHIDQFNLMEFKEESTGYNITSTPTLIHFKDGEEAERIVGYQNEGTFKNLLAKWKKN